MMRRGIYSIYSVLTVFVLAACSEEPATKGPERDFPEAIEVYDDSKGSPQAAAPGHQTASHKFAEFECAIGAGVSTSGIPNEESTRPDADGNTQTIVNYDPTGVTVFGLQARALERITGGPGSGGTGAYLSEDIDAIRAAIQSRYPDAISSDAPDHFESPSMGGFITLGEASDGLTRIGCTPR